MKSANNKILCGITLSAAVIW